MKREGWFAFDSSDGKYFNWCPTLQVDFSYVKLDIWFRTKKECEQFIKDKIINRGTLDDLPDRG
jgi:hypothetical protein